MLVATLIGSGAAAPFTAATIAPTGLLIGLWINGDRAERQRRRDLHARALAAVLAYAEMPFMIRRRRCEPSEQSAERVRLADHFSGVKAEVTTCQVLLGADGRPRLAKAYEELVEVARRTAGNEAHKAWKEPAIRTDAEMNMARCSTVLPICGSANASPLTLPLVAVAAFDVMFAIDSIAAIFAVTTDTFVVFAANARSLCGMVSLYCCSRMHRPALATYTWAWRPSSPTSPPSSFSATCGTRRAPSAWPSSSGRSSSPAWHPRSVARPASPPASTR